MNNNDLESVSNCPLCESGRQSDAYMRFALYGVVRCDDCDLYYLSPRLKEAAMLERYKSETYFSGGESGYAQSDYEEQEKALRRTFHRLLRNLEIRGLTGGSVLEVGCGYGYLLDEARGFFDTRVGTDFSSTAVELARAKADRVYEGGVEEVPESEKFDCVIATQVIEHVYEPKKFMELLAGRLKPGGKAVVATPHMGSFWRRIMGHKWASFKLPEHVLYFNSRSLAKLLKDANLQQIDHIPHPHAFPLSLVLAKLKLPSLPVFDKIDIWIPETVICMYGFSPEQE